MEAFNEYVVAMEDRVEVSRNDKEIKSIGSEIKRFSAELETTKREGKRDAKNIEALTDDWRRTARRMRLSRPRSSLRGPRSKHSRSRGIETSIVLLTLLVVTSRDNVERSWSL
ncbi:unnamed protein product [Brassica rapa subsp. trilocularis]